MLTELTRVLGALATLIKMLIIKRLALNLALQYFTNQMQNPPLFSVLYCTYCNPQCPSKRKGTQNGNYTQIRSYYKGSYYKGSYYKGSYYKGSYYKGSPSSYNPSKPVCCIGSPSHCNPSGPSAQNP